MATLSGIISNALFPTLSPSQQSLHISSPNSIPFPGVRFPGELYRRKLKSVSVVTRAGPNSSQYIFAFVFPFSLLAVTVFAAFRIGDRLDEKFLEELAMNEAIREAEEESDDPSESAIPRKEEPVLSRTRNRPKREV